jgi:hypothetical protein
VDCLCGFETRLSRDLLEGGAGRERRAMAGTRSPVPKGRVKLRREGFARFDGRPKRDEEFAAARARVIAHMG